MSYVYPHGPSSAINSDTIRPVDTLPKENAVAERLEKEREQVKERVGQHSMSRTSSREASHRGISRNSASSTDPTSPKAESTRVPAVNASVRPSFSFANAAAGRKDDDRSEEALATKVDEVAM